MNSSRIKFALALAVLSVAGLGPASAATTWNLTSSCTATGGTEYTSYGNSRACTSSDGITVTAQAWSTTGSNATAESAALVNWNGNGYGVSNRNTSTGGNGTVDEQESPWHSIDNVSNTDMVLFNFGTTKVALNELKIGWWNGSSDTDIAVLRYTKTDAPPVMAGQSIAQLLTNGWQLVDNGTTSGVAAVQSDVAGGTPYTSGSTKTDSFNLSGASSSWWLVSAYNSSFGGNGDSNADYFKLLSIGGNKVTNGTPEPSSLALAALAVFGMAAARRRAKKRNN